MSTIAVYMHPASVGGLESDEDFALASPEIEAWLNRRVPDARSVLAPVDEVLKIVRNVSGPEAAELRRRLVSVEDAHVVMLVRRD
jgi:hypothetical protein